MIAESQEEMGIVPCLSQSSDSTPGVPPTLIQETNSPFAHQFISDAWGPTGFHGLYIQFVLSFT